ncbi:MAG: MFS transporter [Ignavibacteria bacterium]|nr:MFS transporter [Ignavibacteria bacterium]
MEEKVKIPRYSWYALALLTLVYVFNFVDRVLIYILFKPIKEEMHFSDVQLALLGSTSFVIFYTLLGIPFGKLADKYTRKKIIGFGLTVWSLFSGLTGFAHSFWLLFLCRMMVGVGEATLGPAALSLLSDYFPQRIRATVQGVFSSAIAIGTGIAFFFGGWMSSTLGWRFAFYLLGFPGLILVIFILALKEPLRGAGDTIAQAIKPDWRKLLKTKTLWLIIFSYAFAAVASNSISIWLPLFFTRVENLPLQNVGYYIGIATVLGGLPGTLLGGILADKMKARRKGGRLLAMSVITALSIPLWLILLFINVVTIQIIMVTLLLAIALSWLGAAAADVNDLSGPGLRGLATGIYFFVVNAIGYGIAPPLYGLLNDKLNVTQNPELMRLSLLASPIAAFIAATLLYLTFKKVGKSNDVI